MEYCYKHKITHDEITCPLCDAHERIATLEQQLSDEKAVCASLRSQNSDAVKEVQKLEQQLKYATEEKEYYKALSSNAEQIQQAEKRGYELAEKNNRHDRYAEYNETGADLWVDYEQACAERDGGENK